MFHSYNHGLVTSAKGMALEVAQVTGLDVSPAADAFCTVDDMNSNFVQSVITAATGVYTVQLNKPYPPKLFCMPMVSSASATTDLKHARVTNASYDPATGELEVHLINDDDSGAGVAVAGGAADELTLWMVCQRYANL